jgi:hypothetical protein
MKLSKTNFLAFMDCQKNAWLKVHKPDIYYKYPLSSFEQNIIDIGNDIDILARDLYSGGVLVESRDDTELTERLIADKTPVVYQPVFSTDKFITASDIFVWNTDTNLYDLYEVKSSTSSEDGGGRGTEEYLIDIAFQKVILDELGFKLGTMNLIRVNKDYVRNGEVDIHSLLLAENVTNQVLALVDEVKNNMEVAHEFLSRETEPTGPCDCILRGSNSHCTTSSYSIPNLPEYPVHDIARVTRKKLIELVDNKILDIHDVPGDFALSDNQRRQVDTAQSNKEYVDKKGVEEFLKTMHFPLAFLDYETYPAAIPKYDGFSPYQQIPFQFSLHIVESPESEVIHHEFIYTDTECPDRYFAEDLEKYLPKTGSVVVWSQRFEKGINTQVGERLPEFKVFMEEVNNRVIDLMLPFSGNTAVYDHPNFKGSASIKYVLPALIPRLSYKEMNIQEGGAASDTWNRIVSGEYTEEERQTKIQDLKDYCKLDTLAMVEIWKVLKSKTF